MIKVGIVGLGKMGLSHFAIANGLPGAEVVAVCDSSAYVLGIMSRYTGVQTFTSMSKMMDAVDLDAVVISTPSHLHADMVRTAMEYGVHVFCEKPFSLNAATSVELATVALDKGLVTQVGYHYRFVGAFVEMHRLLQAGAIGRITRVLAEAYGPVVLKPTGSTWRSHKAEGGGALYDYAAHPLNLLTWFFGAPSTVGGVRLPRVYSRETEDEVLATISWHQGPHAQLAVSWSDESERKMSTKIAVWGTNGKIFADRQDCQVFLREPVHGLDSYHPGWNTRYTTDLTDSVDFYLRGEEYSAQLAEFFRRIAAREVSGINDFASAAVTDDVLAEIAAGGSDRTPIAVPERQSRPFALNRRGKAR